MQLLEAAYFVTDSMVGHGQNPHTLFTKRNAGLIHPFFLLPPGHWPKPRVMLILSNGLKVKRDRPLYEALDHECPLIHSQLTELVYALRNTTGNHEVVPNIALTNPHKRTDRCYQTYFPPCFAVASMLQNIHGYKLDWPFCHSFMTNMRILCGTIEVKKNIKCGMAIEMGPNEDHKGQLRNCICLASLVR